MIKVNAKQSTTIDLIVDLYSNVVRRMDSVLEAYLGQDGGPLEPDDIPKTNNPVWILGKKYSAVQGILLISVGNK